MNNEQIQKLVDCIHDAYGEATKLEDAAGVDGVIDIVDNLRDGIGGQLANLGLVDIGLWIAAANTHGGKYGVTKAASWPSGAMRK